MWNIPCIPDAIISIDTAVRNNPIILDAMSTTVVFIFDIRNENSMNTIATSTNAMHTLYSTCIFPSSNAFIVINEIVAGPVSSGVAMIAIRLFIFPTLCSSSFGLTISMPNNRRTIPPAILKESKVIPNIVNSDGPISVIRIAKTNATSTDFTAIILTFIFFSYAEIRNGKEASGFIRANICIINAMFESIVVSYVC